MLSEKAALVVSHKGKFRKFFRDIPGLPTIYDSFRSVAVLTLRAAAWVLVSGVLWIFESWWPLRLCLLPGMDRIGQQATFVDVYLRRWQSGQRLPDGLTIFLYRKSANRELDSILRRHANIVTHPVLVGLVEWAWPWIAGRFTLPNIFENYGVYEYGTTSAVLSLDRSEQSKARHALEAIGLGPADWFVTFHARDQAYLDLAYHTYRNGRIENCLAAAEEVVSRGGWAFRLGAAVERALPNSRSPRIVDYATHHRSELLDIYLASENLFHIGSSSGISALPVVFDKPCGIANVVPLSCFFPGARTLWMPKLVREIKSGRVLSFREAFERNLFRSDGSMFHASTYTSMGLEFVENTSDDILGLCRDLFDLVQNKPVAAQAVDLQEIYRQRYLSDVPGSKYAPPIAPSFALNYRALIDC